MVTATAILIWSHMQCCICSIKKPLSERTGERDLRAKMHKAYSNGRKGLGKQNWQPFLMQILAPGLTLKLVDSLMTLQ